jgi:hypothetical protein
MRSARLVQPLLSSSREVHGRDRRRMDRRDFVQVGEGAPRVVLPLDYPLVVLRFRAG